MGNFGATAACFMVSSLLAAGAALAQPAAAPTPAGTEAPVIGTQLQEVTVSASTITLSGYDQPTPVTSIGLAQIQSAAQPDLTDALRQLPAFSGSSSPQNSVQQDEVSNGQLGINQVNLRGLGATRTLVLIDGQRIVDGSVYGGADTSEIPTDLVERVDVVTGGASAIWGSNAVAGVVNYIINHNFNGIEVNLEDSNNNQNAHPQYRLDMAAGTGFDDNRGHIEASASQLRLPDAYFQDQIQGYDAPWLVNNPACNLTSGTKNSYTGMICPPGQSPLLVGTNIGTYNQTPGGVISKCVGPKGTSVACTLIDTMFVGPNATPLTYNPGTVSNSYITTGGTPNTVQDEGGLQGSPELSQTAFLLGSFKVNEHIEATLQGNFGYSSYLGTVRPNTQTVTIYSGNPFIPTGVQSAMTAEGVSALSVGTTDTNPFTGQAPNIQAMGDSVGEHTLFESRRLLRGVFGLKGDLGSNWSWNAYYERSETHTVVDVLEDTLNSSFTDALDAVSVGSYSAASGYTAAKYPNPLGFVPGTITCLSNLLPVGASGETTKCAPLNVFGSGPGVASDAAINYVNSPARQGGQDAHTNLEEGVAAATVEGKLPIGTPAGPVALAAGLVYRNEFGILVDCGYNCEHLQFRTGNFAGFTGGYDVKEASLELNAPLLKDQVVKDLSLNAAYRGIGYSTSGYVQTYKFGVVSQLIDAVRLRASYSVDIRAGDIQDLFEPESTVANVAADPRTGQTVDDFIVNEGNSSIRPERAETRTAGFVFTPVRGLTASLDWWYVRIANVIGSVGTSQVAVLCKEGYSVFCEDLIYGTSPGITGCSGPSLNSCPLSEPLQAIISQEQNIDSETESGLDLVGDYRMPFMAGALDFNTNISDLFEQRYVHLGTSCDSLNGLGSDQNSYPACLGGGEVKFRGTVATSYTQGGWLGTVQARMIGAAHLVTQWIGTDEVAGEANNIPFYTVVDLRLSYRWDNGIQVYGAIDNIGDRLMPATPSSDYSGFNEYLSMYHSDLYDAYGRVWRVGLRARF